jgi:hypothetical protein
MPDFWKIGLLGLMLIPLVGSTCTEEKTVEFVVNEESYARFTAQGDKNVDLGSDTVDLKDDLDLREIALDNGVNPDSIRAVTFRGLCAKIDTADVVQDRAVTGNLEVTFGNRPTQTLGSVTGFSAGAVTDWIDITENVTEAGVAEINRLLADCLAEAQTNGPPATDTSIFYQWIGTAPPTNQPTYFVWSVKVMINIIPTVTADLPDF